jgi:hypothetical protein
VSISSPISRNDYAGNGATSVWTYGFKIFDKTQLSVTVYDSLTSLVIPLLLDVDYTVQGAGVDAGGTITQIFGSAILVVLPTTSTITIKRNVPLTQPTALNNQGPFFPKTIEDSFDRDVMILQQQQDVVNSAIKIQPTEIPSAANTVLPSISARAGKLLGFDAFGNLMATINSISASLVSAFWAPILTLGTADASKTALGIKEIRYGASVTGTDAYVITVAPAPTSFTDGVMFMFKADVGNTGIASLTVNGIGPVDIFRKGTTGGGALIALTTGDIIAQQFVMVAYNFTFNRFIIISETTGPDSFVRYAVDTGAVNAFAVAIPQIPLNNTGHLLQFKSNTTNTGACTISVNGAAVKNLKVISAGGKVNPTAGTIVIGSFVEMLYDGTDYVIINTSSSVGDKSEIFVTGSGAGALGYGTAAAGLKIRRFLTTQKSVGAAVTYLDSALLGASFTINESGLYAIQYSDVVTALFEHGISVNASAAQLLVNISSAVITPNRLAFSNVINDAAPNICLSAVATTWLNATDIIRAHTNGAGIAVADNTVTFRIVKLA